MFCTNCGTPNPDGTKFCTNCGAPLEGATAPVAPVAQKSNLKFIMSIVAIAGSGLMLLGTFLPWVSAKITISFFGVSKSESTSTTLFGTGYALDKICAILILLSALFCLAWSLAAIIPALKPIKDKVAAIKVANISLIDTIVIGVAFLFIIIAMFHKGGVSSSYIKEMSAFGKASVNLSVGAWFAFLGVAALITEKVMSIIKKY